MIEDTPGVQRSVADAEAYCRFIEQLRDRHPQAMYQQLLGLLSDLASSATRLPAVIPDAEGSDRDCETPPDARASVSRLISERTNPDIERLQEFDRDGDEYDRRLMYFDDLSDLNADLNGPLKCFRSGTLDEQMEAAWQWKCDCESYWGRHLMRALQTTHELRFNALAD